MIKSKEPIYYRSTHSYNNMPKNSDTKVVTLFDAIFTDVYNKVPLERVAFAEASDTDYSLSYGQLKAQVLKCTSGLKHRFGIQRSDVVAICSPNSIEYAILFHGIIAAGKGI